MGVSGTDGMGGGGSTVADALGAFHAARPIGHVSLGVGGSRSPA